MKGIFDGKGCGRGVDIHLESLHGIRQLGKRQSLAYWLRSTWRAPLAAGAGQKNIQPGVYSGSKPALRVHKEDAL